MNEYKQFEHLIVEKEENLLWIKLNNPQQSNAITDGMIEGIEQTLRAAKKDHSVRVVIFAGEGKNFCAGGDIKAMGEQSGMFAGESDQLRRNYQSGIQRIPQAIEHFNKPIIAAVQGAAIGAGLDLACMCDLRVASDDASFGETFARLGLVPGDGGTFFLPRVVGHAKAMEMILTANVYSAKEALDMRLIGSVVADVRSAARALGKTIGQNAPVALALAKSALKMASRQELGQHLEVLSAYQGIAQRTSDHFEGVAAMLEKRRPRFEGR